MNGTEKFVNNNIELDDTIQNFWSWYASDLSRGTLRGALAEFIVDRALGINSYKRNDWSPCDIIYNYNGKSYGIEIKSSGLLHQKQGVAHIVSNPRFSIAPHNHNGEIKRHADLYIFCYDTVIYQQETAVTLDSWKFFVASTAMLEIAVNAQSQTISLKRLNELSDKANSGILKANYNNLKDAVTKTILSLISI